MRLLFTLVWVLSSALIGCLEDPDDSSLERSSAELELDGLAAQVEILTDHVYGRFDGIEYTRFVGHFHGATPGLVRPDLGGHDFDVYVSFILPTDLRHWNQILVVEPIHGAGAVAPLPAYTVGELALRSHLVNPSGEAGGAIFEDGFGYASVSWQQTSTGVARYSALGDQIEGPTGVGIEIVASFWFLLRHEDLGIFGDAGVDYLLSTGVSQTGEINRTLMNATAAVPEARDLIDVFLPLVAVRYEVLNASGNLVPGVGPLSEAVLNEHRMLTMLSEAEMESSRFVPTRVEATNPNVRRFEVAGAAHATPWTQASNTPCSFQVTNPLDGGAVTRALFVEVVPSWLEASVPPPESLFIQMSGGGAARDDIGNALGGYRLPGIETGTHQLIAFGSLCGDAVDLTCTDSFQERVPNHGTYVDLVGDVVEGLHAQRLMLASDAVDLIRRAAHSEIAMAATCLARTSLVANGSVWTYLDNGSDQGTAWRAPAFDDIAWASGPAQLGYGDGDEATVVGYGPNPANKYITTYFRRGFNVADADNVTELRGVLLEDDGGVVYLNGVEIFRSGLPEGPILFNTLATTTVGDNQLADFTAPSSLLLDGFNIVTVEMHQSAVNSSDLSFDLELIGIEANPHRRNEARP